MKVVKTEDGYECVGDIREVSISFAYDDSVLERDVAEITIVSARGKKAVIKITPRLSTTQYPGKKDPAVLLYDHVFFGKK